MAGTGKSTIADSVVMYARTQGMSGASFFCSRDFATASDVYRIIPTIVYELAHSIPHYPRYLAASLRASPYPSLGNLEKQMSDLLVEPLKEMTKLHPLPRPCILVIDALDECSFANTTQQIFIDLLLRHTNDFRETGIKFFVASRPIDEIRSAFVDGQTTTGHHYRQNLHDEPLGAVERDIFMFVEDTLRKIPSITFTEEDAQVIAKKAVPLFIFASTLCKFIAKTRYDSQKRLDKIISDLKSATFVGTRNAQNDLDRLYERIFEDAFEHEDEEVQARVRTVVGTILLLREPLSVTNLALLLGPPFSGIPETLREFLKDLHSVLSIPDDNEHPVRAFHASFEDHLTTSSRALPSFYVDPAVHHLQLALFCFRVMQEHLTRDNICCLEPNMNYDEVKDLAERRRRYIPDVLEYACRFWVDHLERGLSSNDTGQLADALKEHLRTFTSKLLLRWADVLAISRPGHDSKIIHDILEHARDMLIVRLNSLNLSTC